MRERVLCVVAACALAGIARAQAAGMVTPPKSAWQTETIIAPSAGTSVALLGKVRPDTRERRLEIGWSFDQASGERGFHDETFALDYWPTAVARVSDRRLTAGTSFLVAGTRPGSGNTVIERWTPSASAVPSPTTRTAITKVVLHESHAAGKLGVRWMTPVNGIENAAFVQFEDSNDLYRIDAATGALTLLLTPAQEPYLAFDTYLWCSGSKLRDGRFVYLYQCDFSQHRDGALLLYDDGGDGTIDETKQVPFERWSDVEALPWAEHYNG